MASLCSFYQKVIDASGILLNGDEFGGYLTKMMV